MRTLKTYKNFYLLLVSYILPIVLVLVSFIFDSEFFMDVGISLIGLAIGTTIGFIIKNKTDILTKRKLYFTSLFSILGIAGIFTAIYLLNTNNRIIILITGILTLLIVGIITINFFKKVISDK